MTNSHRFIIGAWYITLFSLFVYSYTQVDLNLTLSKTWIVKNLLTQLQYIGWFNRPFSTIFFCAILIALTGLSLLVVQNIQRKTFSPNLFAGVILTTALVSLSYNAFSYDLFNYIFDAKIVTLYHQNPYLYRALDFPHDPYLAFMRWTHRTYPYGPAWLLLTIPLSYIGLFIFIITFFLFKLFLAGCFIGSVWLLYKIEKERKSSNPLLVPALFAFNPLVIIESLVSSHNDISMVFFSLLGVYLLLKKHYLKSSALLIFSALIKYATGILLPSFLYIWYVQNKRHTIDWTFQFRVMTLLLLMPMIFLIIRTEYQPWYLLFFLPFFLLSRIKGGGIAIFIFSVGSLSTYIPFLFTGTYDAPYSTIKTTILLISLVLACIAGAIRMTNKKESW